MNVYKVTFGLIEEGRTYHNQGKLNVLAKGAKEAIAKADKKLDTGKTEGGGKWVEVFEGIEFVLTIDIE